VQPPPKGPRGAHRGSRGPIAGWRSRAIRSPAWAQVRGCWVSCFSPCVHSFTRCAHEHTCMQADEASRRVGSRSAAVWSGWVPPPSASDACCCCGWPCFLCLASKRESTASWCIAAATWMGSKATAAPAGISPAEGMEERLLMTSHSALVLLHPLMELVSWRAVAACWRREGLGSSSVEGPGGSLRSSTPRDAALPKAPQRALAGRWQPSSRWGTAACGGCHRKVLVPCR
jgi:hypothetical protein